jgi:hypothetical protein
LHAVKYYDNGTSSFVFPLEEGVLQIFIVLKNQSPWMGLNPANLGSNGKLANHYTTKVTDQY